MLLLQSFPQFLSITDSLLKPLDNVKIKVPFRWDYTEGIKPERKTLKMKMDCLTINNNLMKCLLTRYKLAAWDYGAIHT